MFRQIRKLEAGHYAIFRGGELRITKYWDLEFPPSGKSFSIPERDLRDEILVRLEKSVRSQMVSDVPIGAFLSAGLDSSSIVAMMCRNTDRPVRTYTITFPEKYRVGESALDDPAVPAELARQLGCENEQLIVEPDVVNLVPQLTWHMDEPTADPAIIAAYLVCREAKKQATVMLSGVGGDELFAGYRKHAAHYWAQIYRKIPSPLRGLSEAAVLALPGFRGSAFKGTVRLAKKMARSASLSPQEQFIRNCTYLDDGQKSALYGDGLHDALADQDSAERHRAAFDRVQAADFLNQMLYLDTKIFMVSLNLTYNDKMSMASSVEVRVPFLDRSLAEFVSASVPPRLKLQGTWRPTTKYILRRALEGVLPEKVLNQPKAGFAAPIDYWLANDLRPMVDELLSEATVARRGLFKPAEVQRYIAEHRQGAEDWSMQIWQFLTLELWMQVFLDGGWKQMSTESMLAQPLARA
jgi:asparagine synthase (glutamine-hydrolysing)